MPDKRASDAKAPDLGDIIGIVRLIDTTAKSFEQVVHENTDPNDPAQPRLRMVGGVIMRVPHTMLLKGLAADSYPAAKNLGYRGDIKRWGEILQEAVDQPQSSPPIK